MSVELGEYVSKIRIFLEPLWLKAHEAWADEPVPNPPSKYMCRYSCLFLQRVLKDAGYGDWHIFLGRPTTPELHGTENGVFGYRSTDGKWYDHAWLIKDSILIDITADQYGDMPVIVGDSVSTNYNANMSEDDVKADLQKLQKRVNYWLQEWKEKHVSINQPLISR